ncbi:hypothetical protein [Terribacillus sp. DMT04]|nr:hypothetical protein [Terribacillus sp. DMT04]
MYPHPLPHGPYKQRVSTGALIAAFLVLLFIGGTFAWENIWD